MTSAATSPVQQLLDGDVQDYPTICYEWSHVSYVYMVPHVRLIIAARALHQAYAVANLTSLPQTLTIHQQAVASETENCTTGPAQQQDVTIT